MLTQRSWMLFWSSSGLQNVDEEDDNHIEEYDEADNNSIEDEDENSD